MDPRTRKMAQVLVDYSVAVKPGDWVIVLTTVAGEPMASACAEAALAAGGIPEVFLDSEDIREIMMDKASDDQLNRLATSPISKLAIDKADVTIAILAPTNTSTMSGVDPSRLALFSKAREPLGETMMKRAAEGELRWTVAAYPTPAAAQDANMSLRAYEDFVYGAGLLEKPDPVAAWKQLAARQERLIDWLTPRKSVHITGPGTDLTVGIEGRTWVNDGGENNFPGGEVFTGPIEDATQGVIEFSYPAFYGGREVNGVRLVFEGGRVTECTASSDEEYLRNLLDMDEGARRLGEFAFGSNPGIQTFTKNTLFDEKMGGTLHMALGRAYPETGGVNLSALHWDMVFNLRNGGEVTVDGQPFSRNGEFCI